MQPMPRRSGSTKFEEKLILLHEKLEYISDILFGWYLSFIVFPIFWIISKLFFIYDFIKERINK